jgi:hypothetical protein
MRALVPLGINAKTKILNTGERSRMNHEESISSTCHQARLMAIMRAQHRCEHVSPDGSRCDQYVCLDAHHLTYERYGHERPEDLMIVCRDHHKQIHGH